MGEQPGGQSNIISLGDQGASPLGVGDAFNIGNVNVPGWSQVSKIVKRIVDIPVIGSAPMEVGLGVQGEMKLFSDIPLYVAIEDPGNMLGPISELSYRGTLKKVFLNRGNLYGTGRVAIYIAQPYFGAGFERESAAGKLSIDFAMPGFDITAGNSSGSSVAVDIPGAVNQPIEGFYINAISYLRQGGDVSTIAFTESESGSSYQLFRHRFEAPLDRGTIRLDNPVKISASGVWTVTGSVEAANTNINLTYNAVLL